MSCKLYIVKSFIAHLNANELYLSNELVTPNFIFVSPINGHLNFKSYCLYMAKGSETIETTVRGFDETGNTLIAHLTLDVIDSNLNYFSTMDVTATFGFHDNVIESILMAYEATEADIAYLKKLKKLSGK